MQRVIAELTRRHALTLRSTQVVPAKREGDLTVLAVEVISDVGNELRTYARAY